MNRGEFNPERRKLLETVGKGAVGLAGIYVLSKIPAASAQVTEIDVGTLQVPVTFDGQIVQSEWDNDTIPYYPSWTVGNLCNFVFRAKYDPIYTYMALYAPNLSGPRYTELDFDPKMTGSLLAGADGVTNLALAPSTNGWYESPVFPVTGQKLSGTPISELFKRGTDYDWAGSYFNGMQLEFKFKNDILMKNAKNNEINFNASVLDNPSATTDAAAFSGNGYTPMVFTSEPIPEFGAEDVALFASLGLGAVATTKLAKQNMSRRDFLGVSALEAFNALKKQTQA
jgi:hypothetical protein